MSTNESPFTVTAEVVRINIFWFLSLIIALSAALVGILCKQWIREYQRDTPISNEEAFELRQLQHQSWLYWRVPDIISSTSLLLQLALLLFFAGVVDLLWSRVYVKAVAAVITVAVGLSVLFILVTILLPFAYDLLWIILRETHVVEWHNLVPCAYRSPLSRVLLSFSRSMTAHHWNRKQAQFLTADDKFTYIPNWSSVDLHLLRHYKKTIKHRTTSQPDDYLHRGMKWAVSALGDNVVMMKHLFHCMESSPSAVGTLVPYTLDLTPPDTWSCELSRNYAYVQFLEVRGYGRHVMLHFYIEAGLRCIEVGNSVIFSVINIPYRIYEIHVEDLVGLPQG